MQELKAIAGLVTLVILTPFVIVGRVVFEAVRLLFFGVLFFVAAIFTVIDLSVDLAKGVRG